MTRTRPRTLRPFCPALVLAALAACASGQQLAAGSAAPAADPAVLAESLRATVAYLADDTRAGRSTGSAELNDAARWLSARLRDAGVSPGGDDGSFLQAVPMARFEYAAVPSLTAIDEGGERKVLVYGVDFDAVTGGLAPGELELVVVASEADLPPEPSAGTALFLAAQGRSEQRALLEAAGDGWGLVLRQGSRRAGRREITSPPRSRPLRGPVQAAAARVRGPLAEALASGTVRSLFASFPGTRVDYETYNVVGVLPGAGTAARPELAAQGIVFSAHYDHIGLDESAAEGEDRVFNGADDDASGCAAVLELAEALAAEGPPARTLVFLFATGEEIGLVGTNHYIQQPLVPLEDTVCNLNFEMIGRPDSLVGGAGKLWLTGFERSNLGPAFAAAGAPIVADPRPDQNFFMRSDNIAFARLGIVAQSLSSYDLHEDYHRVTDETQTLDFEHMQGAVRAALVCARALASGDVDPAWEPGGAPR